MNIRVEKTSDYWAVWSIDINVWVKARTLREAMDMFLTKVEGYTHTGG